MRIGLSRHAQVVPSPPWRQRNPPWFSVAAWWHSARERFRRRPRLAALAIAGGLAVLLVLVLAVSVWGYATRPLPPVDQVFSGDMFQTVMVYDRKGRLLSEIIDPNGGKRSVVTLSQVPPALVDATVMTEDPTFYSNPGVDLRAIARAFVQDLIHRHVVSGASTITQQLVRNVVMTPEERRSQSLARKVGEAVLALRVSARYSKDEILQRYLNEIYYGNLAYGVEAASETYFDKPVEQLDLAQAALIAGLPQAPALYDPFAHPDAAKARQQEVLSLMVKHGAITQQQADAAAREPLPYHSTPTPLHAPHFVTRVRELLADRFSRQQIYDSGLRVTTSLDLDLQNQVEQIVRDHLPTLRQNGASDAAVVAIDPTTGEILAYVGSADYTDDVNGGQIDLASASRQPGAALAPFLYLQAIDQRRIAPAGVLSDSPTQYSLGQGQPAWQPTDDDGAFRGPVTARRALATSLSVPTVGLLDEVGVGAYLQELHQLGLATLDQPAGYYGLSLALGAGPARLVDLTAAYATLANGGVQTGEVSTGTGVDGSLRLPSTILRVTDASGRVLEASGHDPGVRLASPQAAWLVTDILSDDASRAERFGAHSALELPDRPTAAKGATTSSLRDSWAFGYTPQLAVGVWVGNADGRPMDRAFGLDGATAIWHDVMEAALKGQPPQPFTRPDGLVRATVDATTGQNPASGHPTVTDWFIAGTLPPGVSATSETPTPTPSAAPPANKPAASGAAEPPPAAENQPQPKPANPPPPKPAPKRPPARKR